VNTPPAKSRINRPFDRLLRYTTSKSSSGSGGFWFLIYPFHISSVTLPLDTTQLDGLQATYCDAADGDILISCVLISAYDVPQIREISRQLEHIPLIGINPRRDKVIKRRT
jgi:hypothetical protein